MGPETALAVAEADQLDRDDTLQMVRMWRIDMQGAQNTDLAIDSFPGCPEDGLAHNSWLRPTQPRSMSVAFIVVSGFYVPEIHEVLFNTYPSCITKDYIRAAGMLI